MREGNLVSEVYSELREGVTVLSLCRPVTNTLSPVMRREFAQQLEYAFHDDATKAVVLRGVGDCFSSGVDAQEFNAGLEIPDVAELCELIETGPKPVVMAIRGPVFGGAFELALAGAARIALAETVVTLSEITLGLIPCAGGTQRLPRLIGAENALEIMSSGSFFKATDPLLAGVFDQITDHDPVESAIQLATDLAQMGKWNKVRDVVTGFADPLAYQQAVNTASLRLANSGDAYDCLLRCVEAALLLPFSQGLALEQAAFEDLRLSSASRAQRHIYVAEKRATLATETQGTQEKTRTIVFLGNNHHLGILVSLCHSKDLDVVLLDAEVEHALASHEQIKALYAQGVQVGKLSSQACDARLSRLSAGTGYDVLRHADIVFDLSHDLPEGAVPELKENCTWIQVEGDFSGAAHAHQTISLQLPELSRGLQFSELAVEPDAAQHMLAAAASLFEGRNRVLLKTTRASGGVARRLQSVFYLAALELVAAGLTPHQVDGVARRKGFTSGPFEQMDQIGLPNVAMLLAWYQKRYDLPETSGQSLLKSRLAYGVSDRVQSLGFYHSVVKPEHTDSDLMVWLDDWRRHHSHPSVISEDLDGAALALHGALLNEAARLLDEGAVRRASDVDVVGLYTLEMERGTGGPLFLADLKGLLPVVLAAQQWMEVVPHLWAPHQRLLDMVKTGENFHG